MSHLDRTAFANALPSLSGLALFLDFDGTLVGLAPTPDAIRVPAELGMLLNRLSGETCGAVAVVSGRRLADLQGFLPGFDGPMIGGHGAERRIGGGVRTHPLANSPEVAAAAALLDRFASDNPAALVERKPTGAVLHFRRDPSLAGAAQDCALAVQNRYPAFELHAAKMAWELRPKGIGKAAAVADLMALAPFSGRLPLFLGDDATDEPAMQWCIGQGGSAVKIGPGDTVAPHRLADPEQALRLLQALSEQEGGGCPD